MLRMALPRNAGKATGTRKERRGCLLLKKGGFCLDVSPALAEWLNCPVADFLTLGWTRLLDRDSREVVKRLMDRVQAEDFGAEAVVTFCSLPEQHTRRVSVSLRMFAAHGATHNLDRYVAHVERQTTAA
jgi:hypothetical protein